MATRSCGYSVGMAGNLETYRRRRHFDATGEPRGSDAAPGARWVIQKHAASSLHYDFRVEAEGVLKSWSVPKGPSLDPRYKRLAIPTEDHPVAYAEFEGVIPEGEYGAGTVLVWDTGHYEHLTDEDLAVAEALQRGRISLWLEGSKLRGGYALTRMSGRDQWLLIKKRDEGADRRRAPVRTQPESVLSNSDLDELAEHGPVLEQRSRTRQSPVDGSL